MSNYKPYSKYKKSGVAWLGDVPEGWEVSNLKYISSVNMGQSPSSSTYNNIGNGIEFLQGNADFEDLYPIARTYTTDAKKISKIDDILFTVRAPVGAMNISNKKYAIGRGLCAISATKYSKKEFLWYLMFVVKIELDSISTGSTYEAVSVEQVNNSKVALPSLKEQTQISNYLNQKTKKIDTLIKKQQTLIELLKEKRQALISHVVTKGLDDVAWISSPLKRFISMYGGYAFSSIDFCEEGIQVIRIGNLYKNKLSLERNPVYVSSKIAIKNKNFIIKKGDLILSLTGTLGKRDYGFSVLIEKEGSFLLNQRVAKLIPNKNKIDTMFLNFLMKSEPYLAQLYSLPSGTKQANLSNNDVLGIVCSFPPLKEQQKIANHLDQKTKQIDTLIAKSTKAIELLKERRVALVSAVVTGKVDVRDLDIIH